MGAHSLRICDCSLRALVSCGAQLLAVWVAIQEIVDAMQVEKDYRLHPAERCEQQQQNKSRKTTISYKT